MTLHKDTLGDALNPRFQEIFADRLKQLPDLVPELFHPDLSGEIRWNASLPGRWQRMKSKVWDARIWLGEKIAGQKFDDGWD